VRISKLQIAVLIAVTLAGRISTELRAAESTEEAREKVLIGRLAGGAEAWAVGTEVRGWGIAVEKAGMASSVPHSPIQIETFEDGTTSELAWSYQTVTQVPGGFVARATREVPSTKVQLAVEDKWTVAGSVLSVAREVTVEGNDTHGFLSGVTLCVGHRLSWPEAEWFAPGMIYGGFDHLSDAAIGGRAGYRPNHFDVRIREDRLPAPLFGAHLCDGTSIAVLNSRPMGATTAADSRDTDAVPMIDERFQFGAIGGQEREDGLALGYWFPGTEGGVTYQGNTYPGGQLGRYRRRYHPLKDGLVQRYEVAFRFGREPSFDTFYTAAWRWTWDTLKPEVVPHDMAVVRRSLTDMLADRIVHKDDRFGIPNFIDAAQKVNPLTDRKAVMGFTGKNLEAANFLLQEAALDDTPRGDRLRRLAGEIVDSFTRLNVSPPEGEGFHLDDGRAMCALPGREVFLRSFGDGIKALLKAYRREKNQRRDHPQWLVWCRGFADWLLGQQQPGGGFPRTWEAGSGEVVSASPNSSFNAVPLLVLMGEITGERKYLDGAIRAADYCWDAGQRQGRFVGGTIDNPDVLDKEAATLSLEAYLLLYKATKETKWLQRARAAANFAATWIYCWNVPMPVDEGDAALHWKRDVSTVGLQLISTGHSLVDAYMAFDADEFAELSQLTGDPHYLDVARILLHNTKGMLAIPGREYDLVGPGWQQEHWSLAPRRGVGLHRGWLPWVATSQLNGIFGTMELGPAMLDRLRATDREANAEETSPPYDLVRRPIVVDGNADDWKGVKENAVAGPDHLWFGQGMTREKWRDNDDLSYRWRGAWSGGKLYFLFEVNDDTVVEAGQEASYQCDCVEVYLDYDNRGGKRVKVMDGRDDWFAKCDRRELMGYELHFLPTSPPRVYLDHTHQYAIEKPQTDEFRKQWAGEVAVKETSTGYLIELGFSVPDVKLEPGKVLGVETGVCDDDGNGRKAIMMWTGTKGEFWVTMDQYGKVTLKD